MCCRPPPRSRRDALGSRKRELRLKVAVLKTAPVQAPESWKLPAVFCSGGSCVANSSALHAGGRSHQLCAISGCPLGAIYAAWKVRPPGPDHGLHRAAAYIPTQGNCTPALMVSKRAAYRIVSLCRKEANMNKVLTWLGRRKTQRLHDKTLTENMEIVNIKL